MLPWVAAIIMATRSTDRPNAMSCDLRSILGTWEYEPGKISVRKIIGRDGREKIQTRVDLGLLQLEVRGRPDGQRPFGCESLLEHHEARLAAAADSDEPLRLSESECRELRQEAHAYYQRYISLFVLEEYAGVVRDTARNLRVMDLCREHAAHPYDQATLETQRAYVLMMNARARAYLALGERRHEEALRILDAAMPQVEEAIELSPQRQPEDDPVELRVLRELRREVFSRMPSHCPARIEHEIAAALAVEDYERAAELRDRLKVSGRRR